MQTFRKIFFVFVLVIYASVGYGQFYESFENSSCTYDPGYRITTNAWGSIVNTEQHFWNGCFNNWSSTFGKPWAVQLPATAIFPAAAADGTTAAFLFLESSGNGSQMRTGSIHLDHPVTQGTSYRIRYKVKAAGNPWYQGYDPDFQIILTDNLNNDNLDPSGIGNNLLPIPMHHQMVQSMNFNDIQSLITATGGSASNMWYNDPEAPWVEKEFCFTADDDYEQIWFRPQLKGVTVNTIASLYFLIDDLSIDEETDGCNPPCNAQFYVQVDPCGSATIMPFNYNPNWSYDTDYGFGYGNGWVSWMYTTSGNYTVCLKVTTDQDIECDTCMDICITACPDAGDRKQGPTNASQGVTIIGSSVSEIALYPNPADGNSTLSFTLAKSAMVEISVFDMAGKLVKNINKLPRQEGKQAVEIDTQGLTSGTYLIMVRPNKEKPIGTKLEIAK